MVVGTSRGVQSFETTDIRNRGGGLAEQWQSIPEAINFWDLGSLDGKPYPLGGGLAVYSICLSSVLERFTLDTPTQDIGHNQVFLSTRTLLSCSETAAANGG